MTVVVFVSFLGGAILWTAGEYHLHRFAMHHLKGRGIASREHLIHHADPTLTNLTLRMLGYLGIVLVGIAFAVALSFVVGPAVGGGVALGWTVGYLFYEMLHWRAHHRRPRVRYELWLRRHHFHHHFGHPMENHGVTTSLWDRVYGTYARPEQVRVPRRLAMFWLLDDADEVAPRYRDDYVLVGGQPLDEEAELAQEADDHRRAFANEAPAI